MKKAWKRGDKIKIAKLAEISRANVTAVFNRQRQLRSPLIYKFLKACDSVLGVNAVTLDDLLQCKTTKNGFFKTRRETDDKT